MSEGVSPDALDDAVDQALARRLVSPEALAAEIGRLRAKGRIGPRALRRALMRRGLLEPTNPSVLEAKILRMLSQAGIRPLSVEVTTGLDARYRIDILLTEHVAVEVDGYTYHSTPDSMAYDARRRNRLRLDGILLLVYTWSDVMHDGSRVLAEIREALARDAA
jgi:very-short-patch-repair endonuclease